MPIMHFLQHCKPHICQLGLIDLTFDLTIIVICTCTQFIRFRPRSRPNCDVVTCNAEKPKL